MKNRLLLLFVVVGFSWAAQAQLTTQPPLIPVGYDQAFTVFFDAASPAFDGGMVGASTCYAHTGVITTASTSESDWKHAPAWGDNSPKYKMEKVSGEDDVWKLEITPNMEEYYGLTAEEVALKLAFVFRDESGKKESKLANGKDILYALCTGSGAIVAPADGQMILKEDDTEVELKGMAVVKPKSMELLLNGTSVATESTFLEAPYEIQYKATGTEILAGYNKVVLIITRTDDVQENDTVSFYARQEPKEEAIPAGMQEGINYDKTNEKVTLVLRAPLNEWAYVLGDFNNWTLSEDYQMNYEDKDVVLDMRYPTVTEKQRFFWCTFSVDYDVEKNYAFQYLMDSGIQISDPYSEVILDPWNDSYIKTPKDPHLPAYPKGKGDGLVSVLEVVKDGYEWDVEDFKISQPSNMVIYELLVRDFTTTKTLQGVMDKLDYLQALGVNVIELMPVTEFDGNDSWGYNPNHLCAYDKAYGSRTLYKKFIDECHKRGIAVVLDMVFNHVTGVHPWAKLYWEGGAPAENNPFLNRVARHPANVFSDVNHEYEGSRYYYKRVLAYWLQEYKVDGYRMDLSKGFTQKFSKDYAAWGKKDDSRIVILKDYCDAVKAANPNAVFILEHLSDYDEEKILSDYGMLPWRNMNNNYMQAAMGWDSQNTFVDSDGSGERGGMKVNGWVGYGESHDEERCMYKAEAYGNGNLKDNAELSVARVPLIIAFSQLMSGPKMLWQFGELGYDYSINYCSGSKMSEECRTYAKPCPFDAKLDWMNVPFRREAYNKSAAIIHLRTDYPEFWEQNNVKTTNCAKSSLTNVRRLDVHYVKPQDGVQESVDIIVLGNFSALSPNTVAGNFTKTGTWYDYLTGEEIPVLRTDKVVTLASGEVRIFTSRKLEKPTDEQEIGAGEQGLNVYPTLTQHWVYLAEPAEQVSMRVMNMQGVVLVESHDNRISLDGLAVGMYLVQVEADGQTVMQRVIKY